MNIPRISKIIAQILGCRSYWNCSRNELVAIVMQSGKFARCSDWLYLSIGHQQTVLIVSFGDSTYNEVLD